MATQATSAPHIAWQARSKTGPCRASRRERGSSYTRSVLCFAWSVRSAIVFSSQVRGNYLQQYMPGNASSRLHTARTLSVLESATRSRSTKRVLLPEQASPVVRAGRTIRYLSNGHRRAGTAKTKYDTFFLSCVSLPAPPPLPLSINAVPPSLCLSIPPHPSSHFIATEGMPPPKQSMKDNKEGNVVLDWVQVSESLRNQCG